jgi:hypothetical protein
MLINIPPVQSSTLLPTHPALLALLSCCIVGGAAAQALPLPGPQPVHGPADCAPFESKAAIGVSASDARLLKAMPALASPQAARLRASVGADLAWWLRRQGAINVSTVPTAFHEANHAIDIALSECHAGKAVYVFNGINYPTELVRGSTAPYVVAAAAVPSAFRSGSSARYQTYMVGTPNRAVNDFSTLLDEFNAYVGAAAIEVELARTPLYGRFRAEGNAALDGNIGGAADLMLYVLSYLKVVRTAHPDSYAKIRNSPLLLAHLQRLWTAADAMLASAAPYSSEKGGLYVYPIAALVAVRSPAYLGELDRLHITHSR